MKTKYMCGVDYQHEFKAGFASIYDSLEEIKNNRPCSKQCGIVEVVFDENDKEVSHKWIQEQNIYGKN